METVQADISEYNQANQLLMAHFDIIGPPAILFFSPNGSELTNIRIIGEADVPKLLEHIRDANKAVD